MVEINEYAPTLNVVGQRNPDTWGEAIVTGKYDYSADHDMPGKLYARILGSKYAHAKIVSVNTSKAEALEGVKAVITYKDNPLWGDMILCVDQSVAAVAAVDEATAERALDLIEVVYDVLPAVFDPEEAMKPMAPLVGTFPDSNLTPNPATLNRGDVTKGFAEADVIMEETVGWVARHTHNQIEPDSAIAWWEGDELHFWVSTQNIFGQQVGTAAALKIPLNKVHGNCHGTGGGFGSKGETYQEVVCALLSKKTGKPVASQLPRRLYTVNRIHQWATKLKMKMGAKNDGTLTAVECWWWGDGGKNGSNAAPFEILPAHTWKVPNFKSTRWSVATNKGHVGFWRCTRSPSGQYLSDKVLEKMAAKLGINPLEFRRKNFIDVNMGDGITADRRCTPGWGTRQCLEKVADAIGYSAKYHAPGAKTLPDGRLHGIGIHAHADGHGSGSSGRDSRVIYMLQDGTARLIRGSTRVMGQNVADAAIVAETIGVTYKQVNVADFGTTSTVEGGGQFGSRLTIAGGLPTLQAALDLRRKLFNLAADKLKVTPDELDAKDGKIFVKADPTKFVTHAQALVNTNPIIGFANHPGGNSRKPLPEFKVGSSVTHNTGCASAAEVAVDPETGAVELLNYAAAVDAGRVIDPVSAEGQIKNGMPVQVNQALFFDDIYDPLTGVLLSFNHIGDLICTSLDIPGPDKNQTFLLETIDAVGPYGAHGIGEPSTSSFASITNAINNAIGKSTNPTPITSTPVTPQKILQALGKA